MKILKEKRSIWPIVLSISSFLLLPTLFYLALANVAPLITSPGVFLVAALPMVVAVAALVINSGNTKLHKTTITISIVSLVLSSIVQLFFISSAILWSAG